MIQVNITRECKKLTFVDLNPGDLFFLDEAIEGSIWMKVIDASGRDVMLSLSSYAVIDISKNRQVRRIKDVVITGVEE